MILGHNVHYIGKLSCAVEVNGKWNLECERISCPRSHHAKFQCSHDVLSGWVVTNPVTWRRKNNKIPQENN